MIIEVFDVFDCCAEQQLCPWPVGPGCAGREGFQNRGDEYVTYLFQFRDLALNGLWVPGN